ncbi:MAG: hypothetical protein AB7V36_04825 [Bacteroidales bacterium]|jgi:hypothetical protein|nr:hypothetical protein [Bacteroidales bacterium]HPB01435.1 hypothetical protein [Bacteroidales bacterium]
MNNKFRILIICISLAGLLWLVNHLNREYTVGVTFTVQYKDLVFPENNKPDSTIVAEVSGRGFSLIRFYFDRPYVIQLSKSDFKSLKQGDSLFLSVLPENLLKSTVDVLPAGISLKNIPNDSLSFSCISYPSKDVPVQVDVRLQENEHCAINGPVKIIPGFVRITGPAEMIANIDSVKTQQILINNKCDTVRTTVKIAPFSNKKISCNISEIHVLIPLHSVVNLQTKLHYNITILGHIYDGVIETEFMAPANEKEPELNLVLESEIVDKSLVFNVKSPPGYKILKITPEFVPLKQ